GIRHLLLPRRYCFLAESRPTFISDTGRSNLSFTQRPFLIDCFLWQRIIPAVLQFRTSSEGLISGIERGFSPNAIATRSHRFARSVEPRGQGRARQADPAGL